MSERDKRAVRDASLVFAVALVPRLVYLLQLRYGSPTYFMPEGGDSIFYDRVAQGEVGLGRAYFHSPLYQWFLTVLYEVFGRALTTVRVLQHLLGAFTAVLVQRLTLALWRRRSLGLWAGLGAAVFGPSVFYEGQLVVDALLPLLVVAAAYGVVRFVDAPGVGRGVWSGLLVGVAALGRATALIFLPLAVWFARKRFATRRPGLWGVAGLALGATLVIAPVTIRNYVVEHDFVLITANGGLNLFIGNNPRANSTYNLPPGLYFQVGDPSDDYSGMKTARDHLGHVPSSSALSRWWTERAIDHAIHHPVQTLSVTLGKVALLVGDFEYPQLYHYYVYRAVASVLWILPTAGFIVVPGIFGLLLAAWRIGHTRVRAYAALTVAYGASFLPFFIVGRYRTPWVMLLLPFAAWGIGQVVAGWRAGHRRRTVRRASALAVLALFSFPRWGHTPNPSHQYYAFGRAEAVRGNLEAAVPWLEESVSRDPQYEVAQIRLAMVRRDLGRAEEAERGVVTALQESPRSAGLNRVLGELLLARGAASEAEPALRRAVRNGPSEVATWTLLGSSLEAQKKYAEAQSAYRSAVRLLPREDPEHPAAQGLARVSVHGG